jgi:thymidylate synthase (FAD)
MTKTPITISSEITVKLVDSMARDSTVIHAAKVSTLGDRADSLYVAPEDQSNAGLINYLMRDRHGSPFEHNAFTFFVKAPIFVFREFMRHRIASYNEESGRYGVLKPEFYIPGNDRNMVQEGKPGAYNYVPGSPDQIAHVQEALESTAYAAYVEYQDMLVNGIAREVARMVLPLNIYSSMYVTIISSARD